MREKQGKATELNEGPAEGEDLLLVFREIEEGEDNDSQHLAVGQRCWSSPSGLDFTPSLGAILE